MEKLITQLVYEQLTDEVKGFYVAVEPAKIYGETSVTRISAPYGLNMYKPKVNGLWTRVVDGLPKSEVVVLVWRPLQPPVENLGSRTLAYWHDGLCDWYSGLKTIKGITHWQYLSNPPKK